MSVLNRQLPPPADWQAFERLGFDLFRQIWRDPGTQLHGRTGQAQAGVDVYGENHEGGAFTGVQFKGREGDYNSTLTEAELRAEVQKAKSFRPALQTFIVATTAPNDVKLQQIARDITAQHRRQGLFDVHVQGWGTLKQLITDFPDLVQKHFPDLAPVDLVARLDVLRDEVRSDLLGIVRTELVMVRSPSPLAAGATISAADPPEDALHARIRDAANLTNDGAARAAMQSLQRLREAEWSTATPRNRYRMLAALASASLVLGDTASAVAGYRDAYAQAPDFAMARAVLATAQLLDGEQARAFASASQALQEDPSCEQAAFIVVQAAPATMSISDLEALLPGSLLAKPPVLVVLSSVARARGDMVAAHQLAEAAYGLDPEGWRACTLVAELLLAPIFDDQALPLTRAVPTDRAEDFRRSIKLLRSAWSKVREGDHARNTLHIAGNLANALDVGGFEAEANQVVEQALQIDATFAPVLRRRAVMLALQGDWQGVVSTLGRMPLSERDYQDRVFLGQAKLAMGEAAEAARIAREVLAEGSSGEPRQIAAALALDAALASGAKASDVVSACDAEPDSMLVRTVAVRFGRLDDRLRTRLAADVHRIVASAFDVRDRVLGADVLAELGQHSAAADLLAPVTDPAVDTLPLQRRLKALLFADRRKEARALFETMPPAIQDRKTYLELGVMIYERVGVLSCARGLRERHCARSPGDLRARLAWLSLCERMGDLPTVRRWFQDVSPSIEGSPQELMTLAHALDRQVGDPKCLHLGYRALRAGYADPKIHLAYTGGLVFFGNTLRALCDEPERIGIDTAVTLQEVTGHRTLVRIIEGEPEPNIERGEIAPDDPLATRLLGLGVGDIVALQMTGLGPVEFRVASIQNKFVHAHFRVLADFERLFPENRAFGSVPIDLSQGIEGAEPMLRLVRDRGQHVRDLEERYRAGNVPVAFVAVAGGASMFDVWDAFAANPAMPINAATGSAEEFAMAAERIASASLAVIDPLTAYAASCLGIDTGLRAAIPRLGVTQTTRDLLRSLLDDRRRDLVGRRGTMAWTGEHYVMHEQTAEEADALVKRAEAAIAFADGCELIPAEGDRSIVDELRGLWGMLPDALLDSVLAAQGQGAILIADDAAFRGVAEASTVVRTTWSQPVLQHGLRLGRVTPGRYAEAVGKLVDAGYQFTMFGSLELTHALVAESWHVRGRVLRLFELIARPSNDRDTVSAVLEEFARSAWHATGGDARFSVVFGALFRAMKAADGRRADEILAAALLRMQRRFRLRAWRDNRREWLYTSSLVPPTLVAGRVVRVADRVFAKIGGALKQSFASS
jgi:tetratricopeptide (TPR) repeat protein